jgi:hypothetical protein
VINSSRICAAPPRTSRSSLLVRSLEVGCDPTRVGRTQPHAGRGTFVRNARLATLCAADRTGVSFDGGVVAGTEVDPLGGACSMGPVPKAGEWSTSRAQCFSDACHARAPSRLVGTGRLRGSRLTSNYDTIGEELSALHAFLCIRLGRLLWMLRCGRPRPSEAVLAFQTAE